MPLNIRNEAVNQLAEQFAARRGVTKTAAVKLALEAALQQETPEPSIHEKIKSIQDYIQAFPATGLEADKAFYDSLNDE